MQLSRKLKQDVRWLCLLAGLCLGGPPANASVIIDGFTPATNDRFANDPSFLLNGVDLSGVGMNGAGRWGTLVSPNVFVSAFHFPPAVSSAMQFFETNDPSGPSETRTVIGGQRIGASDIWVGVLDSPLPAAYSPVSLATADITSESAFAASIYSGAVASLFGRSPTANGVYGGTTRDQAVGTNLLDLWLDSVTLGPTTDHAMGAIYHLAGDAAYQPFETHLQSGDSGGPMLVVNGGVPTLVGVNWFIFEDFDIDPDEGVEELREGTGFSYVGNYDDEILQFIGAHAIPEPSTFALLTAGLVVVLRRRGCRGQDQGETPDHLQR